MVDEPSDEELQKMEDEAGLEDDHGFHDAPDIEEASEPEALPVFNAGEFSTRLREALKAHPRRIKSYGISMNADTVTVNFRDADPLKVEFAVGQPVGERIQKVLSLIPNETGGNTKEDVPEQPAEASEQSPVDDAGAVGGNEESGVAVGDEKAADPVSDDVENSER